MAKRLSVLLIPFAALLACLPLALHGPSCGHDFAFHLLSWQDAANQFAHGTLRPRWAFLPAWGAGEPRFVFYPPLSWTLGALLTLASAHLPGLAPDRAFAVVPLAYTWLSLSAAGFGMAHLARRYTTAPLATLAGVLYLLNPYTLFTAYERTAYAELLAAAWLPLLLAAILPSDNGSSEASDRLPIPLTAIALALLWLTNAPAAVLGSYTLALLLGLRILLLAIAPRRTSIERRRAALTLAIRSLAATCLGFALAAFYIVPAALERPWVTIGLANVIGLRPVDNTLFHHTGSPYHDQVLRTASFLAVGLLATLAIALVVPLLRRRPVSSAGTLPSSLTLCLAASALGSLFLLTPVSIALWHHLPELSFLQFPWRICALLAPLAVLSLFRRRARTALRPSLLLVCSLTLPLVLALPFASRFRVACDAEDRPEAVAHLASALLHHQPISDLADEAPDDPTDEYTPVTADNELLARTNPPLELLPDSAPDDSVPPPDAIPGPAPLSADLVLQTPAKVVLNLRNYPLWSLQNNGRPITTVLSRNDGLLAFTLPSGPAHLTLHLRSTPAERASASLSLLAALLLFRLQSRSRRHRNDQKMPAS